VAQIAQLRVAEFAAFDGLLTRLRCPRLSIHPGNHRLSLIERAIRCTCGEIYPIQHGIPDMRIQRSPVDWQPEKARDGNRYDSSFFVNAFALRQYSPYLNFQDSAAGWKAVARQVVTENYYQTIRALATTELKPRARWWTLDVLWGE